MELKNKDGLIIVTEVEYKRISEARTLLPILRSSVSKTWRLLDKMLKVLDESVSGRGNE